MKRPKFEDLDGMRLVDLLHERSQGHPIDTDLLNKIAPPKLLTVDKCIHCGKLPPRFHEAPVYGMSRGVPAQICLPCFQWMCCVTDVDPKPALEGLEEAA